MLADCRKSQVSPIEESVALSGSGHVWVLAVDGIPVWIAWQATRDSAVKKDLNAVPGAEKLGVIRPIVVCTDATRFHFPDADHSFKTDPEAGLRISITLGWRSRAKCPSELAAAAITYLAWGRSRSSSGGCGFSARMAEPNIVSVRCTRLTARKHRRIRTAVESRSGMDYLAISHLMPFSHQDCRFGWRFGL